MRIEREIETPAAPEAAFAVLADWAGHGRWQPTVVGVEPTGALGPGAHIVEHREGYGQKMTFDVEVTDWQPPSRIRVHAKSRSRIPLAADEEFQVEAAGSGSRVRMALEFDLPLVLRPLAHGVGIEVGKQIDDSLAALRARLSDPAGVR